MKSSPLETSGLRSAVQTRRSPRFPKAIGALLPEVGRPLRPSPKRLAAVVGPPALKDPAQSQQIRSLKEQAQIHFKNKKVISPISKPVHKPPEAFRAAPLSPELPPPMATIGPHVSPVGLTCRPPKPPAAPFRANLVAKVAGASPSLPSKQKSDFTGPLTFEEIMLRKKKTPEDVADVSETLPAGRRETEEFFMMDQSGSRKDPVVIELATEASGEDVNMELEEGETELEIEEGEHTYEREEKEEKEEKDEVQRGNLEENEGEEKENQVEVFQVEKVQQGTENQDVETAGVAEDHQADGPTAEEAENLYANVQEKGADPELESGEQHAEVGVWNSFQHYKQSQISRKRNRPEDAFAEEAEMDKPGALGVKHVKVTTPVLRLVLELISNLQTAVVQNKEIDPEILQDFTTRWNSDASERISLLQEISKVLEAENEAIMKSAKLSPNVATYPKSLTECAEWVSSLGLTRVVSR